MSNVTHEMSTDQSSREGEWGVRQECVIKRVDLFWGGGGGETPRDRHKTRAWKSRPRFSLQKYLANLQIFALFLLPSPALAVGKTFFIRFRFLHRLSWLGLCWFLVSIVQILNISPSPPFDASNCTVLASFAARLLYERRGKKKEMFSLSFCTSVLKAPESAWMSYLCPPPSPHWTHFFWRSTVSLRQDMSRDSKFGSTWSYRAVTNTWIAHRLFHWQDVAEECWKHKVVLRVL